MAGVASVDCKGKNQKRDAADRQARAWLQANEREHEAGDARQNCGREEERSPAIESLAASIPTRTTNPEPIASRLDRDVGYWCRWPVRTSSSVFFTSALKKDMRRTLGFEKTVIDFCGERQVSGRPVLRKRQTALLDRTQQSLSCKLIGQERIVRPRAVG